LVVFTAGWALPQAVLYDLNKAIGEYRPMIITPRRETDLRLVDQ
jgi:hypothetical protein